MTKLKTLKDIKISTSSTDDIEQMLIEQSNLEYSEKLKMVAREWIKASGVDIEEIIGLDCDWAKKEVIDRVLIKLFNLEEEK